MRKRQGKKSECRAHEMDTQPGKFKGRKGGGWRESRASGGGEVGVAAGPRARSLGVILVTVGVAAWFLNRGMTWANSSSKTEVSKPTDCRPHAALSRVL